MRPDTLTSGIMRGWAGLGAGRGSMTRVNGPRGFCRFAGPAALTG
jgi:hypothetical protein